MPTSIPNEMGENECEWLKFEFNMFKKCNILIWRLEVIYPFH
jgi:hypothetical protein